MKTRYGLLISSFAFLLLVGAGCVGSESPADTAAGGKGEDAAKPVAEEKVFPPEGEPIRLGFIAPITGDAVAYGEPDKNITQIAVDEINAGGGIAGHRMEVIYEDGKCNGKDAVAAMQKLANVDKVHYVIGGFCSGESLAAAPIANEQKVVLFSGGSSSPDLTTKGGPYFFRNYPSDAFQGKVLAEVAYEKGWRTIGILEEQTDYASALSRSFTSNFERLGGKTSVQAITSGNDDFRTMVTKLKSENVDAVFISLQTPNAILLALKQMKELDWKVPTIGSEILAGSELPKTDPELVEGMIVAEYDFDPENPKLKNAVEAYKKKYGSEPPYMTLIQTAYDIPFIFKDAIEAVGDDPVKVQQWLSTLKDWQGASGSTSLDENGDLLGGHTVKLITGGKVVKYQQ